MFQVIVGEKAGTAFEKLPLETQVQIQKKINEAIENPLHFFKRLSGRTDYRLRVGKYRIIADINLAEEKITILFIGHRKNIYEKI